MINKQSSNVARLRRHKRVRKAISGTASCPRLCVFRSLKNIYAQIIDDVKGTTLVAASSLELEGNGGNKDAAKKVGELVAKKALEKGITEVVFDRGGFIYQGKIQALADAAREAGLNF